MLAALFCLVPLPAAATPCADAPETACVLIAAEQSARAVDAAYARKGLLLDIAHEWIAQGDPARGAAVIDNVADLGMLQHDVLFETAARAAAANGDAEAAQDFVAEILVDVVRRRVAKEIADSLAGAPLPHGEQERAPTMPEEVLEARRLAEAGAMLSAHEVLIAAADTAVSESRVLPCGPDPDDLRLLTLIAEEQTALGLDATTTLAAAVQRLGEWWRAILPCRGMIAARELEGSTMTLAALHVENGDLETADLLLDDFPLPTLPPLNEGARPTDTFPNLSARAQAAAEAGDMTLAQTFADMLLRRFDALPDDRKRAWVLDQVVAAVAAARSEEEATELLVRNLSAERMSGRRAFDWQYANALALAELGRLDEAWPLAMDNAHYRTRAPAALLGRMVERGQSALVYRDLAAIPQPARRARLLLALARELAVSQR